MKKFTWLVAMMVVWILPMYAQNIGINTQAPQATLDVRGSQRFGGNNAYLKFDSATGRIEWIGAALYVPVNQQIIRHSASAEGLYAGGNRMEYRGLQGPVFFTDWQTGNGFFSNRLGIGTINPVTNLHVSAGITGIQSPFSPAVIEGTGNAYINLISVSEFETGILFGRGTDYASGGIVYNNASTPMNAMQFRTNGNQTWMTLNSLGFLGIGTLTPDFILDINDRMRIRSGGNLSTTAGVWLNKTNNLDLQSFFGIENDTYAGIYGIGSGWSFGMNTTNGDIKMMGRVGIGTTTPNAPLSFPPSLGKKITLYPGVTGDVGFAVAGNRLQIYSDNPNADVAIGYDAAGTFVERFSVKPNGALALNTNTGLPGQVLQSNGGGNPVSWTSPTNILYNSTEMLRLNTTLITGEGNPAVIMPGLDYTFNISGNAKALVSFTLEGSSQGCVFCGNSIAHIDLYLDGNLAIRYRWDVGNNTIAELNGRFMFSLNSGQHNIHLKASSFGPAMQYINGATIASNMIVQVIPQ